MSGAYSTAADNACSNLSGSGALYRRRRRFTFDRLLDGCRGPQKTTRKSPISWYGQPARTAHFARLSQGDSLMSTSNGTSLSSSVIKDDGVQRAAAGMVIAVVVAIAKKMIFPSV